MDDQSTQKSQKSNATAKSDYYKKMSKQYGNQAAALQRSKSIQSINK